MNEPLKKGDVVLVRIIDVMKCRDGVYVSGKVIEKDDAGGYSEIEALMLTRLKADVEVFKRALVYFRRTKNDRGDELEDGSNAV